MPHHSLECSLVGEKAPFHQCRSMGSIHEATKQNQGRRPVVPAVATPTSIKRAGRRMSGRKEIALRSSSATCHNTRRGLQR
uniref:Uncharacterized protein n=1 Tax=Oryza glaberrima TaxID=4538 RepID=I1Q949_ORYGL